MSVGEFKAIRRIIGQMKNYVQMLMWENQLGFGGVRLSFV